MTNECVIIKGTINGILVQIDDLADYSDAMKELQEKLSHGTEFFSGSRILLDFQDRSVEDNVIAELGALLIEKYGIKEVSRYNPFEKKKALTSPLKKSIQKAPEQEKGVPALIVKKTMRGGQSVNYKGGIVVLGDVNPGAELIAAGDIVVLGALRGVAHAGAEGDESCSVIALQLTPTQLRIASKIGRSPDGGGNLAKNPEMAYIKDGQLVIEEYNHNHK